METHVHELKCLSYISPIFATIYCWTVLTLVIMNVMPTINLKFSKTCFQVV